MGLEYNLPHMATTLYVDGSNLFGGISELLPAGNYINFRSFLDEIEKDFTIDKVKFYATYMRLETSPITTHQLNAKAQIEFLNSAKACDKVEFIKGYFSGFNKEKGIDMKLGLDLYIDGRDDDYDEAILMSGDADFNYAVDKIKATGKTIHMIAFASRFPFGMVTRAKKKYVYDYNEHFINRIVPSMKRAPYNVEIREIGKAVKIISI